MSTHNIRESYEDLTDKELRSRLKEVQYKLIQSLRKEAMRLDNKDDVESLTTALDEAGDTDFDMSRYWGYDTRADAPTKLKAEVKQLEQLQGIYFERQAAIALAEQMGAQRRRNAMLLGGIALIICIVGAWIRFVPNRFDIDLRQLRLKKLTFVQSFETASGQKMSDVAKQLQPPPPRFATQRKRYSTLAKMPASSLYGAYLGVWQYRNSDGTLHRMRLTGAPDRVTQQRLYKALLPLLLKHPKGTDGAWLTSGLIELPGAVGKALLPTLRKLQRDTSLVRFHDVPMAFVKQIQQLDAKDHAKHKALMKRHKLNKAIALLPLKHPKTKAPLTFQYTHKQSAFSQQHIASLITLLEAEVAPWFASAPKGKNPLPSAPKSTFSKQQKEAFAALVTPGLWDALLRGIPQPIARYQQSFRAWRHEHKRSIWLSIYQNILKAGLSPKTISGPGFLFRVTATSKHLSVQPLRLLALTTPATNAMAANTPKAAGTTLPPTLLGMLALRFPKLYTAKGRNALMSLGQLYPTFERLWRANVPVHPQFSKQHARKQYKTSVFARFGREIFTAQQTLRTVAYQRRAAFYLLEMIDPKVGPLMAWMRRSPIKTDAQLYITAQIRKRVGIISYHTPIRNGIWRIRMAHVLRTSCRRLLSTLERQLLQRPTGAAMPPPMRLLRARLHHEQGRYTSALQELFQLPVGSDDAPMEMLAFAHPQLRFKQLKGDARRPLAPGWSALFDHSQTHNNGTPTTPQLLLQSATTKDKAPVRILAIKELPPQEVNRLMQLLNKQDGPWRKDADIPFAKTLQQPLLASEQLLLRRLPVRNEIKRVYQQLNTKIHRQHMALELAFGCQPPSVVDIPLSRPCKHPFFKSPTVLQFLPPLSVKGKPNAKRK